MTSPSENYCTIALNKDQVAKVAPEWFEALSTVKWYAQWAPSTKSFYAMRRGSRKDGRPVILMHRIILGLSPDDPRTGDHALHDTLDNREFVDGKENLRLASNREQQQNHRKHKTNTSGFKGVSFRKWTGRYRAQIRIEGKRLDLGERDTAEAAFKELYVPAALKHHGRFARLE
jgi:hypothetical protein